MRMPMWRTTSHEIRQVGAMPRLNKDDASQAIGSDDCPTRQPAWGLLFSIDGRLIDLVETEPFIESACSRVALHCLHFDSHHAFFC